MTKSTEGIALNETELHSNGNQSTWTPSPVYGMLPTALQTGLQPLALVRRSLSAYSLNSRSRVTSLVMCRSKSEDKMMAGNDMAITSSRLAEVPSIRWRFARHGSHILQTSLAESQITDAQSQAFSRQLYLDAMAYLLQGLPTDLTDQEKVQIEKALPQILRAPTPPEMAQPNKSSPSILHRSLASIIITICLLIRLALPYIKLLLAAVYSYDRAHHVRERVFAFSITAADSLGKRSMALASTAITNDVVLGAVTYWVDGIRGGLNEGFDQGLRVIENENES